jgi:hypothetical protein
MIFAWMVLRKFWHVVAALLQAGMARKNIVGKKDLVPGSIIQYRCISYSTLTSLN